MQDLKVTLRIDAETGKVKFEVKNLKDSLKDVGDTGEKAGSKVSSGMKKAESSTNSAKEVAKGMRNELVRLASVGFAAKLIKDTIGLADEMKLLDARINLVTDSQETYNTAQQETLRIALDTHTAIGTTVDLYARLERSLAGQEVAQKNVLQITETINKALAVSGATAAETSSVITQLSQGLAAGALRGEEFNAVNESGSRVMLALKDSLGVTAGELRKMAFAGELTTEVLTNALLEQSSTIADEFNKLPVTIDKALTDLKTQFSQYAKGLNESADITGKLSASIEFLGKNLETILDTVGLAIETFIVFRGATAIGGVIAGLGRASAATQIYSTITAGATAKVGLLTVATGRLSAILKANPIGLALTAGFLAYEGINALIDAHNEKLEELSKQSDTAAAAIKSIHDEFSKGFDVDFSNITSSIDILNRELNNLRVNYARTQAELVKKVESGGAVGVGFDVAQNLISGNGFNTSEQLAFEAKQKEIQKEIENTKALATANKFLTDTFGPLIAEAKKLTDAQNAATQSIEDDKKAVDDWLTSSQKQLEKITAKNLAYGKTSVELIKAEAAAKKALTTDVKQLALIDKTTAALVKQTKQYEAKVQADKDRQELAKEEIRLTQEYGTEAQKIALLDAEHEKLLEKFPSLEALLNKEYAKQIKSLKGLNPELKKHIKLMDDYESLLKDLGLIDDVEASFLALELRIESIAKTMNLSATETEKLREAVRQLRLEAENQINVNVNINASKGFSNKDSFLSLLDDGNTLVDIFNRAGEGLNEGIQSASNSMNVLLEGAQFLSDVWNSHSGQDSVGQVINSISDVAATGALGPVAQAIAQVANTINGLTGGRLFGTSYQVESSAFNVDLAGGGSGGTTTTEVRQRSLFRGRQWQETFDALTGDALAAIRQISEQRDVIAQQTAIALGTTAAELVSATFQQVFDAEGNVTSSSSVINGRTYNDQTIQEFASRTYSEQIIAGLIGSLPQVEREVTTFFDNVEREFGTSIGGFSRTTSQMVDEVDYLAETFRNQGVDALAEFAEFALRAVVDIKNGAGLLGNLTDTLGLIQDLQKPGQTLTEAYTNASQALTVVEDAMGIMGITTDQTREQLIRGSVAMADFAGGVSELSGLWNNYFETFYTPEELNQRSIQSSSELLGQQAANLGIDPTITAEQYRALFEQQLAAGNLTEEQTVQWLQFGQTLGTVNDLIDQANQAELDRVAALNEAITKYNDFGAGIRRQIDDINGVNNSLTDIRATYQANIATYNDLAIAAGRAGASEQDLADAHELYVAQIRQATQALFDQLYGDNLDARIAELESQQTGVINSVSTASSNLFDQWQKAIDNLRDYTKSRLVDSFSPLEAKDRLAQAQSDFFSTLAAAKGGDLQAVGKLRGLADTVDQLNQAVNASGSDYNEIFYAIQDGLNSVNIPDGISNTVGGGGSTGVSPELQALYDQRDARLAEQTTQNRLELATQLAQHLNALATAINQPLFAIAEQMGLSLNSLVNDLGVDLGNLTAASVQNLANISNLLGVNLTDLAQNLGDDVSFALGDLADAQSLLNDALENTIGGLPTEYTDLLTPLLRDVENAADGTAQEQALSALSFATGQLPAEYRNQLAPYFADIDPTTEMADALAEAQTQTAILIDIRDFLANPPPIGPGDPSPNPLSANTKTTNSVATIEPIKIAQQGPVPSDPELLQRIDNMGAQIIELNARLRQLNNSNELIVDNTQEIATSNDEIATNSNQPIVTSPRTAVAK